MTDYTELIKALRCCAKDPRTGERCKDECPYGPIALCLPKLKLDAAAAIEEMWNGIDNRDAIIDKFRDEILSLRKQLPKRGEWVEDTTTCAGPGLSNYKCSLCGKICGTWRRGLKPNEPPNWCGNCGADMRKTEAQE